MVVEPVLVVIPDEPDVVQLCLTRSNVHIVAVAPDVADSRPQAELLDVLSHASLATLCIIQYNLVRNLHVALMISRLKPLQRHHNPLEAPLSSPVTVDRIEGSLPVEACIDIERSLCLDAQQAPTETKPDFAVAAGQFRSSRVLRCDFLAIRNLAVALQFIERSQQWHDHVLESLVGLRPSR